MTQQQLRDLIVNHLGPICDAADRMATGHHSLIGEYLHFRGRLNTGEITQQEFDEHDDRIWARLTLRERLIFLVQLAKEDGALPERPTTREPNWAGEVASHADQNWAAIVDG